MASRQEDTAYGRRHAGVQAAESLAGRQHGVVSRRELAAVGVSRFDIAREVRRGRWMTIGRHTVAVHRGPLPVQALWRRALWEVGARARLDGATALAVAGLDGYDDAVHVAVPHGSSPARPQGVVVHEVRRWSEADVSMRAGMRAARVPVAAVQAAAWACSDRQAALLIVMPVQQRLTTGGALLEAAGRFKRLRRRELICCVAADAADGAHSLGELDFGRECRRRGLPVPDRQVVRSGRRGRVYLDVRFTAFGVVVEIEGVHHDAPINAVDDALRQNELSIGSDAVLRIPLLGLRVDPEPFIEQVARALRARGWRVRAAGSS